MGMRDVIEREKGVKFDPSVKVLVKGIQNGVEYVTTAGRLMDYDANTVEVLQDPYVDPKEQEALDKKAATAAKAKATKAANKKAKTKGD